jgi:pyruvate/2-oxoglutarate dehydrogenase complex dihydrolipoamide dehydrogenase (E3) component
MSKRDYQVDLCIIGAGSAGLSAASGAAQLGLSVVLFEQGRMGGDCLNVGCVPSKALIEAARRAQQVRDAGRFGVEADEPRVDWGKVQAHVRGAIAAIAPNDSQERFEGLGVTVIREGARFVDARTVESQSARVRARRFIIATGSRPVMPTLPGLEAVAHHSNESIFDIDALPGKLIVLGGGAVGVELGQAFRRLGAEVCIVEAARLLGGADREAVEAASLRAEGVELLEGWSAVAALPHASGVALTLRDAAGAERIVTGTHLLITTGRKPALDGLGLEAGGIAFDARGIKTDDTLRSVSNRRVWALGDAAGRGYFTHAAGWHASVWVRNVLFKARTRVDAQAMPSVVFSDPELAQIGLTEAEARARHGDAVKVSRWSFHDNDRAHTARDTDGFCKIVSSAKGAIVGATLVGAEAGELIAPIGLAMAKKLSLRALTEPIIAYPTRVEIVKRAASAAFAPILFSDRTRALVNVLKRIP